MDERVTVETEVQIKETDDSRTDRVVSATGLVKEQMVTVEKNLYKKWIGWIIGIVVLIIGVRLYFYFNHS